MRGIFFLGVCLLAGLGLLGEVRERDLPRGTRGLWDVPALMTAPVVHDVDLPCADARPVPPGVKAVWIESVPYRDRTTRVFAWWGLPAGARPDQKVPAMVLVHGGGGTAFASWVKTWNDRGYAAIAMDTCGKMPRGEADGRPHATHPWSGPAGWDASVNQVDEPVTEQWTYHAVAAVLRSHAFLRTRPEVDASRIGLTGISWGGYLTSIVMGVDHDFRFAAPVYGCGWYDLSPCWQGGMGRDQIRFRKWLALWDPKNFLQDVGDGGVRCPVLWCASTNDFAYPLDAVRRSCNALDPSVPLLLSLKLRMPHGHPPAGDPPEIAVAADHFLKDGRPLATLEHARVRDGRLTASVVTAGRTIAKVELLATCDANPNQQARAWTVTPAVYDAARGTLVADVPAGAVMFFANLVTDDGRVTSSRIFTQADWGLVNHPCNPATDWMAGKVGLFTHYLYGASSADKVAADFDVAAFVRQVQETKADYVCLTLGQNSGWMCAPNATYETTAGYPIGSRCCPRDIPGELAAALKPHGVKLFLYLPCQAPNQDAQAEDRFGFGKGAGDRLITREAGFAWARVIEEWSRRYGDGVAGWWFDGGYRWIRFDDEIAELYAAAVKRGNPQAVVAFNEGVVHPVRPWTQAGDYLCGEVNEPFQETCAGRWLGDRQWHLLTFCGRTWGEPSCRFDDAAWINWLKPVLKAGGAVTVDVHIDCPSGRLAPAQVAQLARVFAAVRSE